MAETFGADTITSRNHISKEEIYVCIVYTLLGIFFIIEITKEVEKEFRQNRYWVQFQHEKWTLVFVPDTSTGFRFSILKPSFGHRLALGSQ